MVDPYYVRRPPPLQEMGRMSGSFAKLFGSGTGLPPHVITQQPSFGSQVSNTSSMGLVPMSWSMTHHPLSPPQLYHGHGHSTSQPHHPPIQNRPEGLGPPDPPTSLGIPLPGLEILDRIPFLKVTDGGILSGSCTCSPNYGIRGREGDVLLNATTSKLFCPFDARMKTVGVRDGGNLIFQIKFLPSICECDSEEKRCFAVFSPLYESPFGAILFEAGQIKYSLRIINALEGETFAVQFISSTDISIVGADTRILAIINILRKRGEKQKYAMTFTEDISTANKALFLACIITLDLVSCEATCSKCICLTPFLMACLTIFGLTMASTWDNKPHQNPKP